MRSGSDRALLTVSTVSFQDGERRGAGDDSEKGGGHAEEPNTRYAHLRATSLPTEQLWEMEQEKSAWGNFFSSPDFYCFFRLEWSLSQMQIEIRHTGTTWESAQRSTATNHFCCIRLGLFCPLIFLSFCWMGLLLENILNTNMNQSGCTDGLGVPGWNQGLTTS